MTQIVIPKFPEDLKEKYKEAADGFRFPYWDWAAKKDRNNKKIYDLPEIAKQPRIQVLTYDGATTAYVDNPMYKFKMPGGERMGCSGVPDIQDIASDGSTGSKITTIPVIQTLELVIKKCWYL